MFIIIFNLLKKLLEIFNIYSSIQTISFNLNESCIRRKLKINECEHILYKRGQAYIASHITYSGKHN